MLIEDEFLIEGPYKEKGGQHVTYTTPSCKVTHLPTGIAITMPTERSQVKNKEKAIKYLRMILDNEACSSPQVD